ncbi:MULTISPECIES: PfkB family carbohydrate kinase [unclassified Arthrobacter]|uniref:PfkB family carbohydrate kinase n=1 Tax=unclassified Arthrobacter TaxID=235627 RepID=UPI0024DFE2F4|nr:MULTISPECIES: PfkB family carbohydrate kinase [unclassified Arthrobacter]MCC9144358.1 PfkB family carbohydrate kinase [Arthrobacter sp. zg-Y919]MDK1275584.1 PfkB family carbohydrate kinase [Arthrobacter sp. zg.Y919]WIB03045.1 PfkB family carbohydrate kinase [Arthrobacter sp. zg-Y919]
MKSIVVVGDVLLDTDISGSAQRLSPDAPVPVVEVDDVGRRAGGAGLVARMLERDGRQVQLVTVLSDDDASGLLRTALAGIPLVEGPSNAPTPVKTRIRAGTHAVVRFDSGCSPAPVPGVTPQMLAAVAGADAVVVADYGRGLTANPLLRELLAVLAARIPVVWDPHPAGTDPVPGVAAVTPNLAEALHAAGLAPGGVPAALHAAERLLARWQSQSVVLTMGAQGALALPAAGLAQVLPAPKVSVDDTCGAGDRFAASLTARLLDGAGLEAAAEGAVQAAASFLAAGGVASLETEAPLQMPGSGAPDAMETAARVRERGGTVVATGGCFDLLHAGHARTLLAARGLGDCLIVCLNSDDSVRRLKGEHRPIIGAGDRAELLQSLECVDGVLVFEEDTPTAVLDRLRPDIWVKGGDYREDQLPEAALIRSWGGETVTVPFHPARSTTALAAALAKVG